MTNEQKVVTYFIDNPLASNIEVSIATGVSKSSVQRYLKKNASVFIPTLSCTIGDQLAKNALLGRQKGGRETFKKYAVAKDASGQFTGVVTSSNGVDKEKVKQNDIKAIVTIFMQNPTYTLDQLVDEFSGHFTRDYIYRSLTDIRVKNIFDEATFDWIKRQLANNQYGVLRKFMDNFDYDTFVNMGLSERDLEILRYRYDGEHIRSAEEVATKFGISKTTVTNLENRVLEQMTKMESSRKRI